MFVLSEEDGEGCETLLILPQLGWFLLRNPQMPAWHPWLAAEGWGAGCPECPELLSPGGDKAVRKGMSRHCRFVP